MTNIVKANFYMKFTPLLVLSALVAAAPTAFAASTTDITVTGTITPAACTPSLGGGGDFDFGAIAARDLNQDRTTIFNSPIKAFSVVCDAPTRYALRAVDGRAGTDWMSNGETFGLGLNGAEKIGYYSMNISNYTADGSSAVESVESLDGGASWIRYPGPAAARLFNTNTPGLDGASVGSEDAPSAIGTLTTDFQVRMNIAPARDLTLTDDIQIDGAATIEVVYL